MNQFLLQHNFSNELQLFAHITEFALKKINTVQFNSLQTDSTDDVRIYYVLEGKFEWIINEQHHILYPGDLAFILPGVSFGGEKNFLNIGTLSWIHIHTNKKEAGRNLLLGPWSNLSNVESRAISKILLLSKTAVLSRLKEAGSLLHTIRHELLHQEIGYCTRVNQLIDELFILIARQLTKQNNSHRDFPKTFMKLEETLRENLAHQWTVEEMAALVGLGTTAFTEKVKNYTGFSPLNYLINIRISEAIKLLKREDVNVTDIALDIGFYSSQHFSTTFKKLTGYTPSEFRKNNIRN